jgi:hypothetical protein
MDKIDQTLGQDGLQTTILTSELDGKMYANYKQDLSANVDFATALRNDDQYWKDGVKAGWAHAVHIPAVVQIELRSIGIDFIKAPVKEIIAGMRRLGYDYLITTRKNV